MKSKIDNAFMALFIAFYSFLCLLMSRDKGSGIFSFNSLNYQLIKIAIVFISIYLLTIINKKNIDKITSYCSYYTMLIAIVFFVDYCFIKFSGSLYFRIWWLIVIHMANAAVYLGVLTLKKVDFKSISAKLTKGYSILYIVSFVSVFLRPMGNAATKNFEFGEGTFKFIPYLIEHPTDWEIWFITAGNVIFFIPIAFILKVLIPKIKTHHQIIIGLLIPFFIEGYQLIFRCGDVDIDDIVFNFIGYIIGLILLEIQNKVKKCS